MRGALASPTDEDELERVGGGATEGLKADADYADRRPRSEPRVESGETRAIFPPSHGGKSRCAAAVIVHRIKDER